MCGPVATIIAPFMRQQTSIDPEQPAGHESDPDVAWRIVLAAARGAERMARAEQCATFALANDTELQPVSADERDAAITWRPGVGWETAMPAGALRHALIDLYLPICSATADRPVTIGHLGQSLDGFIATHAGESRWVTGPENILHAHRLRALCDAVVVGAGTVAADDPQLTTRLVAGPNPLRVILDPARRLGEHHRVFNDDSAETLYICARSLLRPDEHGFGRATIVGVEDRAGGPGGIDLAELVRWLRARGCTRIFVEGGGVTVSMFLEASLLDRLHMAIAPLLIGDGRPAIRLAPRALLGDCHRPRYRVFRMGADVLFDFDLGSSADEVEVDTPLDLEPQISRII
jgi:diaminohydroxyphosphoribosylaminopyrimidine deaminase/5-amino-6-(5-phosphoribosylamino)uracil reductase